jgi:hypothetical protein
MGAVKRLGRLPLLAAPDATTLREAFATRFERRDFETAHGE